MNIQLKTEEYARSLGINIAMIATCLESRGLDISILDRITKDCRHYITDRVKGAGIIDPVDAANSENLIIMVLMHTTMTNSLRMIDAVARDKGAPSDAVVAEMITEMEALYKKKPPEK